MSIFKLDTKLEEDSIFVTRYQNIQIRLMKDARFFWLLLIPERADICEWHDLSQSEQQAINTLTNLFSKTLKDTEKADKINIGALGNMVRQFHFHIILRYCDDIAWPGPVWGAGSLQSPSQAVISERHQKILHLLEKSS